MQPPQREEPSQRDLMAELLLQLVANGGLGNIDVAALSTQLGNLLGPQQQQQQQPQQQQLGKLSQVQ